GRRHRTAFFPPCFLTPLYRYRPPPFMRNGSPERRWALLPTRHPVALPPPKRGPPMPNLPRVMLPPRSGLLGLAAGNAPLAFRTIQVCPKDFPTALRQVDCAAIHACRLRPMNEQILAERRRSASDIVGVVFYSIVVLLVMLLWVYVPG